jgi:hypothetical protein
MWSKNNLRLFMALHLVTIVGISLPTASHPHYPAIGRSRAQKQIGWFKMGEAKHMNK